MTSLIAAGGLGRSASVIPPVPAAWSVTTIAFIGPVSSLMCLFRALSQGWRACCSRTHLNDRLAVIPLGRAKARRRRPPRAQRIREFADGYSGAPQEALSRTTAQVAKQ